MRTLPLAALLVTALAAAACGDDPTTYTVAGKTLTVAEQNFGAADYYCSPLANGQFMVIISDFAVCDAVHAGMKSRPIFHGVTETNLRLIFPSMHLKKVPPQNTFTVGKSDCDKNTDPNAEAIAIFAHATAGMADYDTKVLAKSGTITLLYPGDGAATTVTGSFDLTFETGDHIKGSFNAPFCKGMPGIGIGFGD